MKHYNWMTPEEAVKELERWEYCWYRIGADMEPVRFVDATDDYLEFDWIGLEQSDFIYRHTAEKCICRALVPEVPSE